MKLEKEDREFFGRIINQIASEDLRCLWPDRSCKEKSIRAHSIQNSSVLDLLCDETNHVIMPHGRLHIREGPLFEFKKIGRNKATTFSGLCDKHDAQLFEPIDKNKFDSKNHEHLFLIAYRSVLREYHTKLKAGQDIQSVYLQGAASGRFDPGGKDEPAKAATLALIEAYMFYLYKIKFDQNYLEKEFGQVEHKIDFIDNIDPSIAVSSVYSPIDNIKIYSNRRDPKCLILNIFPQDKGIYLIFSFKKEHRSYLLPQINRILEAERNYKLYLVSKLVLMHCENFVMSPKFYKSFSEEKIVSLKNFFIRNMLAEKTDDDNLNYYLFSGES